MSAQLSDYLQDVDLPQTYPAPVSWVLRMLRSLRNELIDLIRKGGLSEAVLSVNGAKPAADGSVTIDVGVRKINGNSPDASGNITVDDMVSHAALMYDTAMLTDTAGTYMLVDRCVNTITIEDDTSTSKPSTIALYILIGGALVQVAMIGSINIVGNQIAATVRVLTTSGSPYISYAGSESVTGTATDGVFQFLVNVNGVRVAFALSASCGKLVNAVIKGPDDSDWVKATSTSEVTVTAITLQPPATHATKSRDFYINLYAARTASLSFPSGILFYGSDADALGPVPVGSRLLLHFTETSSGSFFVDRKEQVALA